MRMNPGRYARNEPYSNQSHRPTSEGPPFEYSYTSRALQESPEPSVPLTSGVVGPNVPPHYRYPLPREGYVQPLPQSSTYENRRVPPDVPSSFHSQGETGWHSGQSTLVNRYTSPPPDPLASILRHPTTQNRGEYIPTWLASQPSPASDDFPVHYSRHATVPSFEHSGMAQAHAEHPYAAAYERTHVPAWKESQYSGEFRRQEMDARVTREDYVRITSPAGGQAQGSQSSGSAHSFSSGGATAGSCGWTGQDVTSECEFCGRRDLLSTLKDHWLSCQHRNGAPASRRGIWMNQ